jgi:hypothetical protein
MDIPLDYACISPGNLGTDGLWDIGYCQMTQHNFST